MGAVVVTKGNRRMRIRKNKPTKYWKTKGF
jgi:hypothetical protein